MLSSRESAVSGTRFLKVSIGLSICALVPLLWLFLGVPEAGGVWSQQVYLIKI